MAVVMFPKAYKADRMQNSNPTPSPSLKHSVPKTAWMPILAVGAILAIALAFGRGNSPKAELNWLSSLAATGDDGAQLELGLAYLRGSYGLTADPKTGLYWVKKSADAGNAYAADQLGNIYAQGLGTPVDRQAAERWWEKAARAGRGDAAIRLAQQLLRDGHEQQAQEWLHAAAEPKLLLGQ